MDISGIISSFANGFNAVSTAIKNAFPFAFFNCLIFLSKDGPAAIIIAGISSNSKALKTFIKFAKEY